MSDGYDLGLFYRPADRLAVKDGDGHIHYAIASDDTDPFWVVFVAVGGTFLSFVFDEFVGDEIISRKMK